MDNKIDMIVGDGKYHFKYANGGTESPRVMQELIETLYTSYRAWDEKRK